MVDTFHVGICPHDRLLYGPEIQGSYLGELLPMGVKDQTISNAFLSICTEGISDNRGYMIVYIYSSQGTSLTMLVTPLYYYKYKLSYTPYNEDLPGPP